MARPFTIPLLLTSVLIMPVICRAQATAPAASPCPSSGKGSAPDDASTQKSKKADQPSQTGTPCAPPAHDPSAAEKFPFPGSASAPAMPGFDTPAAPEAPAPSGHHSSASDDHPFPGSAPPMPGSSSSSSSSSDGYSSSSDNTPATGDSPVPADKDKPDAPRNLGRRRLPKVGNLQSDEDRVDEDVRVARFYEGKGDLNAAYLRLRDAVKTLPTDSESHYELARIAQMLNKKDEAITEYSSYLKIEPDGRNIKKAEKALGELQPK